MYRLRTTKKRIWDGSKGYVRIPKNSKWVRLLSSDVFEICQKSVMWTDPSSQKKMDLFAWHLHTSIRIREGSAKFPSSIEKKQIYCHNPKTLNSVGNSDVFMSPVACTNNHGPSNQIHQAKEDWTWTQASGSEMDLQNSNQALRRSKSTATTLNLNSVGKKLWCLLVSSSAWMNNNGSSSEGRSWGSSRNAGIRKHNDRKHDDDPWGPFAVATTASSSNWVGQDLVSFVSWGFLKFKILPYVVAAICFSRELFHAANNEHFWISGNSFFSKECVLILLQFDDIPSYPLQVLRLWI